jgi:anti-sigma B factor antagonist
MTSLELKHEWIAPDIGCVYLSGRLDIPGVQEVQLKFTVCTATQRKPVIVDLSDVTLITSIGLGMLISGAHALKTHGVPMILLNPPPNVTKVLEMACVEELLPIERDLDAALRRINS